ncbi:MAG: hypothetical protein MJ096_05630 [Clostridia bacterium]|nr:hypothetical protein [Clostridia bacterium]
MKKTVCTLLAILFVVCAVLTSCGGSSIVGEWKGMVDLTDRISKQFGGEIEMTDVKVAFDLCFTEDGTFTLGVNKDSLREVLTPIISDSLKKQLGTDEDVEAYLESTGLTVEYFVDNAVDSFDTDEITASGIYKLEDDKLFFANEDGELGASYVVVGLSSDELKITELVTEGESEAVLPDGAADRLPIAFSK